VEVPREKTRAGRLSIVASILLTALKLAVGLVTNSLAVMSITIDSAFDVAGSATTYLSLKVSGRPPDSEHLYGHGKAENLGGLLVTALLLITVSYVVYEALRRMFFRAVEVVPGVVGFAGIAAAIVVEAWLSRYLKRAAERHRSHVLNANALQFRMDVWTQSFVMLGLLLVDLGYSVADPLLAILISSYIAYLGLRVGKSSVDVLLDRAPTAVVKMVQEAVGSFEGVKYDNLRVRTSGPQTFVDLRIHIPRTYTLERAHSIASEVEERVREAVPAVDVVIHVEAEGVEEKAVDRIRRIASEISGVKGIHDLWLRRVGEAYEIDAHMQVDSELLLSEAHRISTAFEEALKKEFGEGSRITVHIDTEVDRVIDQPEPEIPPWLVARVREAVLEVDEVGSCDSITFKRFGDSIHVSISCTLKHDFKIEEAHRVAEEVEKRVSKRVKGVAKVFVHTAPPETD